MDALTPKEGLAKAAAAAGGMTKLADAMDLHRTTVFGWRKKGIPVQRLDDVSRITGLSAADLRPDLAAAFAPALQEPAA